MVALTRVRAVRVISDTLSGVKCGEERTNGAHTYARLG
jgi:hypothetical protein